MARLPGYASALLNVIAGPESAGRYDVIYGGKRFSDFSDHPRVAVPIRNGPNAGKTSSAAGKYQFLGSTWDQYKNKLGLPDFSPQSQDMAAYALASDTYKAKTGRSLDATLQSGDPKQIAQVGKVLNPIWTSLPGGIEAGTNTNRFVSEFTKQISGRAPAPRMGSMDLGGSEMADAGPKQSKAIGGLGGLGGFVPPERDEGFDTGGLLRALGAALISGDASVIPQMIQLSQDQRDKTYERRYDTARDDWRFGIQRQDRAEDRDLARQDRADARADRRADRADTLDWRKTQFEYQVGQDRAATDRAERTLTLQERLATQKAEGYRTLTPDEVTQRGLPPGSYQIGPDGKLDEVGKQGGQTINVNNAVPGDNKLLEKLSENEGKRWSDLQAAGTTAAGLNQDLGVLDELIKVAPQGPVTGRLAEIFPEATDAGAAFQSVISRAAPGLRVEGSGATSDIEYDGMLKSLPRLRNSPEANRLILDTMKAKADINVRRAEIVNQFQNEQISASEARSKLNELNKQSILSPGLKAAIGLSGGEAPAQTPGAAPATAPQPGTVEDGYRFKGGNPSDPKNWELVS